MRLKKYNSITLVTLFCLCNLWAVAQPTRRLTVEDLFTLGVENSRRIEAAQINQEIAKDREALSRSNRLPEVNFGLLSGYVGTPTRFEQGLSRPRRVDAPNWMQNYSIEATQTIYQGGKINRDIERAAIGQQIAARNTDLNQAQVKLALMGRYLNLLQLYKQAEVLSHNIEESTVRLHDIRQMRKEGMITQNDVIRSELQLTNYELALQETRNDIAILSLQLTVALGLDEELLLELDTTLLGDVHRMDSYAEYLSQAYANYPELKIARSDVQLAQIETRMAKANYLPTLSIRGANILGRPITSVSPAVDLFKNSWNVSLVLSYNISTLYRNKHQVSVMQNNVRWQQSRQELLMQELRTEVKAAYIKHQEALDRITALIIYVQQSEENYRIVQNKYLNQLAILTDLLDAANVRFDAQLQLTAARANEVYTYYQLLRSSGNL